MNSPHGAYQKPAFEFQPIADEQIEGAINALSPMKALWPNGISNAVSKQYLGPIFRVTFSTHHYLEEWKKLRTIVLWKPNKPDYTMQKGYRSIALLGSISKILSSCVT